MNSEYNIKHRRNEGVPKRRRINISLWDVNIVTSEKETLLRHRDGTITLPSDAEVHITPNASVGECVNWNVEYYVLF